MASDVFNQIKAVMDRYNIPVYIWAPIAATESGFNADSVASNSKELSQGIFQINLKAHPEYANYDLYDPAINAEIAARDFIAPALQYAQNATQDKTSQALIVYSGLKDPYTGTSGGYIPGGAGIRPKWTAETMSRFVRNYNQYSQPVTAATQAVTTTVAKIPTISFAGLSFKGAGGTGGGIGTSGAWDANGTSVSSETSGPWQGIVKFAIIAGLAVIIVYAIFNLFKDTAPVKIISAGADSAASAIAESGE